MAGKREKYDWLFIIDDWSLKGEFKAYKKKHPKVKSEKRLARSFVKSKHLPIVDFYKEGHLMPVKHISRVEWF